MIHRKTVDGHCLVLSFKDGIDDSIMGEPNIWDNVKTLKEGENVPQWMVDRVQGMATFEYKYAVGVNELLVVLDGVTEKEIQSVKNGSMAFGIILYKSTIFFIYLTRIGGEESEVILFGDCPFSYHLVPPEHRSIPEASQALGLLQVILVERGNRVIKAIRNVGLPAQFATVLFNSIRSQAKMDFDEEAHDREVNEIWSRFQTALQMFPLSPVVCMIPEN